MSLAKGLWQFDLDRDGDPTKRIRADIEIDDGTNNRITGTVKTVDGNVPWPPIFISNGLCISIAADQAVICFQAQVGLREILLAGRVFIEAASSVVKFSGAYRSVGSGFVNLAQSMQAETQATAGAALAIPDPGDNGTGGGTKT